MLRGGVGAGYASIGGGTKHGTVYPNMSGPIAGGSFAFGGAVHPGIALGCELVIQTFTSPFERVTYAGTDGTVSSYHPIYGSMALSVDWFPSVESGWLLGASAGFSGLQVKEVPAPSDTPTDETIFIEGGTLLGRFGYLLPIGPTASLGATVYLGYGSVAWDGPGASASWMSVQASVVSF